jgi:hypothetical protein
MVSLAYAMWTVCAVVATMALAKEAKISVNMIALGAGYMAAVAAWAWLRRDRMPREWDGKS